MSGPLTSVAIGCSGMMDTMTLIMMRKSSGKSQRQAKSRARRSAMEECGQGSQVTMTVGREVLIRLAWRTAQFVIEPQPRARRQLIGDFRVRVAIFPCD